MIKRNVENTSYIYQTPLRQAVWASKNKILLKLFVGVSSKVQKIMEELQKKLKLRFAKNDVTRGK